jgi:hypothetical protein
MKLLASLCIGIGLVLIASGIIWSVGSDQRTSSCLGKHANTVSNCLPAGTCADGYRAVSCKAIEN